MQDFEQEFARYTGAKHAIAVSSGTAALFLLLKALGIGTGDKVIVPSLTFTASASVILHAGGEVVFADVDRETYCLDWDEVVKIKEDHIVPKAIIAVDLTGNDALAGRTEEHEEKLKGIPVIIDSAHRVERNCHESGQLRAYSFHGTKNMTTGFGGMITTDDDAIAKFLRLARMHGCFKHGWEKGEMDNAEKRYGYEVLFAGWKMNMNNLAAGIGLQQLRRLDEMNAQRARCVGLYNYRLKLSRHFESYFPGRSGLHLFPVFVENRARFIEDMAAAGIECSIHFDPLHKMLAYKDALVPRPLTQTEWIGEHIVSLPLFPALSTSSIEFICTQIKKTGLLLSA